MKKNRMMRLASILLVCVLLTTSVISGTFAKYTTSVTSSDSARVAKWGFTATTMDLTDLFSNVYLTDADENVKSTTDVIAPGTTGSDTFQFVYSEGNGAEAPEVAYTFTVSTEGSNIAADIKNNTNIKWKLDEGNWGTWDELLNSIKNLSGSTDNSGTKTYQPGVLPTGFTKDDNTHTVSWKWAFDDSDDAPFTASDLDTTDTAMGNGAIDALVVTLKITITATQID